MSEEDVLGGVLQRVAGVLREDDDLWAWFEDLRWVSPSERRRQLLEMAARMKEAGEAAELVQATECMSEPAFFDRLAQTVRELRGA